MTTDRLFGREGVNIENGQLIRVFPPYSEINVTLRRVDVGISIATRYEPELHKVKLQGRWDVCYANEKETFTT